MTAYLLPQDFRPWLRFWKGVCFPSSINYLAYLYGNRGVKCTDFLPMSLYFMETRYFLPCCFKSFSLHAKNYYPRWSLRETSSNFHGIEEREAWGRRISGGMLTKLFSFAPYQDLIACWTVCPSTPLAVVHPTDRLSPTPGRELPGECFREWDLKYLLTSSRAYWLASLFNFSLSFKGRALWMLLSSLCCLSASWR